MFLEQVITLLNLIMEQCLVWVMDTIELMYLGQMYLVKRFIVIHLRVPLVHVL